MSMIHHHKQPSQSIHWPQPSQHHTQPHRSRLPTSLSFDSDVSVDDIDTQPMSVTNPFGVSPRPSLTHTKHQLAEEIENLCQLTTTTAATTITLEQTHHSSHPLSSDSDALSSPHLDVHSLVSVTITPHSLHTNKPNTPIKPQNSNLPNNQVSDLSPPIPLPQPSESTQIVHTVDSNNQIPNNATTQNRHSSQIRQMNHFDPLTNKHLPPPPPLSPSLTRLRSRTSFTCALTTVITLILLLAIGTISIITWLEDTSLVERLNDENLLVIARSVVKAANTCFREPFVALDQLQRILTFQFPHFHNQTHLSDVEHYLIGLIDSSEAHPVLSSIGVINQYGTMMAVSKQHSTQDQYFNSRSGIVILLSEGNHTHISHNATIYIPQPIHPIVMSAYDLGHDLRYEDDLNETNVYLGPIHSVHDITLYQQRIESAIHQQREMGVLVSWTDIFNSFARVQQIGLNTILLVAQLDSPDKYIDADVPLLSFPPMMHAEINLLSFTRIFEDINLGSHGNAYLVTPAGKIVASADSAFNKIDPNVPNNATTASALDAALLYELELCGLITTKQAIDLWNASRILPNLYPPLECRAQFYHSGDRYNVYAMLLEQSTGLPLTVAILRRHADYVSNYLSEPESRLIITSIVTFCTAVLLCYLFTRWLLRPLNEVLQYMRRAVELMSTEAGYNKQRLMDALISEWNTVIDPQENDSIHIVDGRRVMLVSEQSRQSVSTISIPNTQSNSPSNNAFSPTAQRKLSVIHTPEEPLSPITAMATSRKLIPPNANASPLMWHRDVHTNHTQQMSAILPVDQPTNASYNVMDKLQAIAPITQTVSNNNVQPHNNAVASSSLTSFASVPNPPVTVSEATPTRAIASSYPLAQQTATVNKANNQTQHSIESKNDAPAPIAVDGVCRINVPNSTDVSDTVSPYQTVRCGCDTCVSCSCQCRRIDWRLTEVAQLQSSFTGVLKCLLNNDALENMNTAKREFLRYIFHEVRVPFNAMVLGIEQLINDFQPYVSSNNRALLSMWDTLNILSEQSEIVTHILNDVLSLQKIEAGALTLEYRLFHLETMIYAALYTFKAPINERKIKLKTNIQTLDSVIRETLIQKNVAVWKEPLVSARFGVIGDLYRIRQVISNLLSNTIKFSNNYGEIRISMDCSQMELDEEFINYMRQTEQNQSQSIHCQSSSYLEFNQLFTGTVGCVHIRLSVRDHGRGVPAEYRHNLFQTYTQINAGKIQKSNGTGLGLSLSKSLIELHGGTIGYKPMDQGSEFYFILPLAIAMMPPKKIGTFNTNPLQSTPLSMQPTTLQSISASQSQISANHPPIITPDSDPASTVTVSAATISDSSSTHTPHESNDNITIIQTMNPSNQTHSISVMESEQKDNTNRHNSIVPVDSKECDVELRPSVLTPPPHSRSQPHRQLSATNTAVSAEKDIIHTPVIPSNNLSTTHTTHTIASDSKPLLPSSTVSLPTLIPPFKLRILVVEDSAPNRKLLVMSLTRLGCSADSCENGVECIYLLEGMLTTPLTQQFKQTFQNNNNNNKQNNTKTHTLASSSASFSSSPSSSPRSAPSSLVSTSLSSPPSPCYDLILMDNTMPELDGVNATRTLRSHGLTIPIVGVTGNALQEDIEEFIKAGANQVLVKHTKTHTQWKRDSDRHNVKS